MFAAARLRQKGAQKIKKVLQKITRLTFFSFFFLVFTLFSSVGLSYTFLRPTQEAIVAHLPARTAVMAQFSSL